VAFQGESGAYGEQALAAWFGDDAPARGCPAFSGVFDAVARGECIAGVVPVENSLAGSVLEVWDLLLARDLHVVGELHLPVRHCLLAAAGTPLEQVTEAYSHPQALAQCAPFLDEHGIAPRASHNTAVAARELSERPRPGAAAIASARAGSPQRRAVGAVGALGLRWAGTAGRRGRYPRTEALSSPCIYGAI